MAACAYYLHNNVESFILARRLERLEYVLFDVSLLVEIGVIGRF